ncbi:5'-3' exoribonuclease 1 [Collichthys lucidus]|uniref:5'-3' exoribonuclease 1 n=1 Tax=Collichthys lucidus TaxID=240159 RepID=A0A4U5UYT2_COLLU|nr:5'-3' exoribonuclease 1 [Collichthys lucidus]
MGVPKFYRWISERYPCLSEVVKEHQIPEFDNLYLDMNGIIHQCSHPNDEDVHFRISEEKIFADIFHYLEVLFRIIKPRKVFFMAVDGVAPRAKMNQQRGRRFRSAKEAEDKIKKALDKGEVLPTEARFDSNCITPGTEFMVRLQEQLKYFVHNKLSTDKLWQNVRVYLSGHETPGEGEHKIMEFIRSENSKPGHNPNTRHCLYGLDADLIILGLTSHEPNFSLLREEEHIGGDYNLERIIDDWILMGFLVGNDFIPHLPHLHISHDALPLLYRTYISVRPSMGGYLNENGHLNLRNFEKYLEKLSEFDREHFSEVFVDLKWFESKVGNKYLNEAAGLAAEKEAANKKEDSALCLAALTSSERLIAEGKGDDEEEEDDMFETEFRQYKRTYYMTKIGVDVVSDDFLAMQAKCYVEGIQWILHYYYHGVQSWSWYYPYHYAPFLSDVRNISGLKLTFDLEKPFMPFQQLLAVLPAASKELLPESYRFYKKKLGVVVFQQSSRGENTILDIFPSKEVEVCDNVASQVLGKSVFVNWPHLEEARIIAVSDGDVKFCLEEPPGVQRVYDRPSTPPPTKVTCLSDKEKKDWVKDVQGLTEHFLKRKGIVVNETEVVLYGQLLTGRKYVPKANGVVELEKQWAKQVLPFANQTVVKDIKAFYSSLTCFKSLDELFPPTTTVFMVGNPYYGAMGEVQDSSDVIKDGRVRVVFNVPHEPQLENLIQNQHKYCVKYSPGYVLASRLGITSYLVSRFSGSIFIGRGSKKNPCGEQRANVGLNLKFNKKNEEVPGYTKRTEKEWLYSVAVEELLAEYLDRFSEVFNTVSRNSHDDVFYEDDVWPGLDQNGAEKVAEITSWLKSHPVSSVSRTSCDLQVKKSTKKVRVTVKPHLLFRPLEQQQGVVPDPDSEYRLFDRVVNIRESFTVPLGLRGTIVGIKGAEREAEVLYEVLFDDEFAGGLNIRCTSPRGYRLPPCALINLSHGARVDHTSHKLTAIVKPQPATATNFNSQRQLSGLNHSPRSPFIPTQHNNKHGVVKAATQGSRNSPSKGLIQKPQGKGKEDYNAVWQSLQSSGPPQKPPAHWHSNGTTEFEDLIASLKISKGSQQTPPPPAPPTSQSDGPLSPQSFAMKGTLVLKEMLKIDGTGTGSPSSQETSSASGGQQHNRRRSSKKLAANMNSPHGDVPTMAHPTSANLSNAVLSSKVSELACVCVGLGMAPPEFSFIGNRQNSVGSGFPLGPPLYPGVGGLLLPPQGYGPAPLWGMTLPPHHHQNHSFYGAVGTFPGAARHQPAAAAPPIGSHNQFIPLQVTKKRVSANKKNQDTREFYSAAQTVSRNQSQRAQNQSSGQTHAQSSKVDQPHQHTTNSNPSSTSPGLADGITTTMAAPHTPPRQSMPATGHTPGSASKRKHRKLAVNFEAAKVSE